VEAARKASPATDITLVSREADLPYYRLNLTRYLAGEITEKELPVHPEGWYDEHGISLLRGAEASSLSLGEKTVDLRDGRKLPFEKLILTVGAHPFIPPVPGASREGVVSLRTFGDAQRIREMAGSGAFAVCIGGGILGLETAGALARQGARVTLLESHEWLMPRQLNQRAGEILADYARGSGITVLTSARTREVIGDERAAGVHLEDGTSVHADFIVITAGIRPNSYLARCAGLHVNQGIVVDDHLKSSHTDVFAAGDVAEHRGVLYGIWSPAQYQGSIAGTNAAGNAIEFGGIPMSNTLKVLGIGMTSAGSVEPLDGSYLVIEEEKDGAYMRFLFRDNALVGAVLLGDTRLSGAAKKAIENRTDLSDLLGKHPSCRDVSDHLAQETGKP
jgi:nitrite reductase (NADH) large subunit